MLQFSHNSDYLPKLKDFTVSLGATNSGRSLASTNAYTWRHYEIQASHNIVSGGKAKRNMEGLDLLAEYPEGLMVSSNCMGDLLFVSSV